MSQTTSKLKKKKKISPCPSTNLDLKNKSTTLSRRNPLKDLNTTRTITKTRLNTRTFNYTSSSSNSSSNLTSSLSIDSPKGCLRFFLPNSKNPPSKSSKRTPKSAPISKPRCKPPISNKSQRTPFLNKSQNDRDSNFGNFEHTPNPKSSVDLKECGSESLQWSFSRILIEGNCDDDRTPVVSKKECRSGLDEKEVTPPVQASISPEIQCGSSFTSGKSTCFGAGHVLSGIPDKRKCRARGILAVEEEKELGLFKDAFSIDDKSFQWFFDNSRQSLIPAPIDASMHWLSPPGNKEENDHQKDSFQNGSTRFPSPSSSSSCGHGFSTDICNSNSTSNTTSTKGKNICLVSPNVPLDFGLWGSEAEMSNEKRGYQYETPHTKISPSSVGDCACLVCPSAAGDYEGCLGLKALMANEVTEQCNGFLAEKSSPSNGGDSLGSYNAVCTPQSDSSLEDCVAGLSWFKNANCHEKPSLSPQNHTSMCDPADVLPLPGFSFQFLRPTRPATPLQKTSNDWSLGISSASCGSSLQSQMRISWRDGVVSRIFEIDDLDCCRLLSDDEEEDISCKNGANVVENDVTPNEPVSELHENDKQQCNVNVFEKSNSCAESINAEGGEVNTSSDSDWNLCYKNQLFEG
ncbi:Gpi-anchored adhesin-like protein [Thalictrum thalictroides]|uniref:Gpi-anchored adhesin-like protein n=1 Tax=Thalictrum thalictroides TaxID=46969 RepID=A0A7J6VRP6_THATH|nr:Gpi-anchored adhesin-like protein [Thalictrum thalictroides]